MLVLHKVRIDGTVEHAPFSKEAWEAAMVDPKVKWRWAHRPEDCFDITQQFGEQKIEHVQKSETPPSGEAAPWPPEGPPLYPELLRDMSTLGIDDARAVLAAPRKEFPKKVLPPMDKGGQWRLF